MTLKYGVDNGDHTKLPTSMCTHTIQGKCPPRELSTAPLRGSQTGTLESKYRWATLEHETPRWACELGVIPF